MEIKSSMSRTNIIKYVISDITLFANRSPQKLMIILILFTSYIKVELNCSNVTTKEQKFNLCINE